jgi:hypothetical protein
MADKNPPSPKREDKTLLRKGLRVKPAMTVKVQVLLFLLDMLRPY